MDPDVRRLIDTYNPDAPLSEAWTIPASWYLDPRIAELEQRNVFRRTWQPAGRATQLREAGKYVSVSIAGAPVVIVRGTDGLLRGFFNVCRHHGAEVVTQECGTASKLRCPYHGWTYSLSGELKSAPELGSVAGFDARSMGLIPLETAAWENWVFVKIERGGEPLENFLGPDLIGRFAALRLDRFHWFERRRYHVDCNWKVFIDNYLDGGYHVPHLHHALGRVLDYSQYTIENGVRFCLQSSPMTEERTGDLALYYWIYPNFMINRYADAMDTNLVVPRGVDQTEVIFDYYFTDVSDSARPRNLTSIAGSERVQDEDRMICESVQRGLQSGAYTAGRLSARREAGEYLFHRLLHTNLSAG